MTQQIVPRSIRISIDPNSATLFSEYTLQYDCGGGTFGRVYQALHKGTTVAMKIFKDTNESSVTPSGSLKQGNPKKEFDMLNASKGLANVLQVLGWGNYEVDRLFIVMEIHEPIKIDAFSFNLPGIQKLSRGFFKGLNALHQREIVHADIKPKNCLVNAEGEGVIADLGAASYFDEQKFWPMQTVSHRDPRVFIDSPWDHTIDLWGMGCTLFELAIGEMLFYGQVPEDHQDPDLIEELHTLHLITQLLGMPPSQLIHSGVRSERYFHDDLSLRALPQEDLFNEQEHSFHSLKKDCLKAGADESLTNHFVSLIGRLVTYGEKISAEEALKFPFFASNQTEII
jgi:serine/threonine protein kinase